jgi:hypothetical protein
MTFNTKHIVVGKHVVWDKGSWYVLRAFDGPTLVHCYEGENLHQLFGDFEMENPSFKNVPVFESDLSKQNIA